MVPFLKSVAKIDRLESLSLCFSGELISTTDLEFITNSSVRELKLGSLCMGDTEILFGGDESPLQSQLGKAHS